MFNATNNSEAKSTQVALRGDEQQNATASQDEQADLVDLNEYIFVDIEIKSESNGGGDEWKRWMAETDCLSLLSSHRCYPQHFGAAGVNVSGSGSGGGVGDLASLFEAMSQSGELTVTVRTNVTDLPNQVPSVLDKIEAYLFDERLDETSVSCLIKLVKEEWLKLALFPNHFVCLFVCSLAVSRATIISILVLSLYISSKTKVFYKFYQSPSVQSKVGTDTLLRMLKLEASDELALKYWQAGLSNECKVQIRTS